MICGSPAAAWMRSCVSSSRSCPPSIVRIRPTLKKVMRALGHARDLDVALLELEEFNGTLSENDRANLLPLQAAPGRRAAPRARTRCWPSSIRVAVQKDFDKLTADAGPPRALSSESQPVSPLLTLSELIRARYKKVRKAADRLTAGFIHGGVPRGPRAGEKAALRPGNRRCACSESRRMKW